jgi:hypothetical protein
MMTEELNAKQAYPHPADQFYPIPQADAEKLRDFFYSLNRVGLDEQHWYYWFVGFLGAPCSRGQIDQLVIDSAVVAERERCAKIAEKYQGYDENWAVDIAAAIRKGE